MSHETGIKYSPIIWEAIFSRSSWRHEISDKQSKQTEKSLQYVSMLGWNRKATTQSFRWQRFALEGKIYQPKRVSIVFPDRSPRTKRCRSINRPEKKTESKWKSNMNIFRAKRRCTVSITNVVFGQEPFYFPSPVEGVSRARSVKLFRACARETLNIINNYYCWEKESANFDWFRFSFFSAPIFRLPKRWNRQQSQCRERHLKTLNFSVLFFLSSF